LIVIILKAKLIVNSNKLKLVWCNWRIDK